MGYRINYRPVRKLRQMGARTSRICAMSGLCLLLFLLLVQNRWPDGYKLLDQFLNTAGQKLILCWGNLREAWLDLY